MAKSLIGVQNVLDQYGEDFLLSLGGFFAIHFGGWPMHEMQSGETLTLDLGEDIAFDSDIMTSILSDRSKSRKLRHLHSILRSLVRESYEVVREYADRSGQHKQFCEIPSQPFHRFARNAVSHDFRWKLRRRNGDLEASIPTTFRGCTITADMHDTAVTFEQLSPGRCWHLFRDLRRHVGRYLENKIIEKPK